MGNIFDDAFAAADSPEAEKDAAQFKLDTARGLVDELSLTPEQVMTFFGVSDEERQEFERKLGER